MTTTPNTLHMFFVDFNKALRFAGSYEERGFEVTLKAFKPLAGQKGFYVSWTATEQSEAFAAVAVAAGLAAATKFINA